MASALEKLRKARQGSVTSLASSNITGSTSGTLTGGSALAKLRSARTAKTQLTPVAQIYASDEEKKRNSQTSANKNTLEKVGREFLQGVGGVGYTLEKAGLGFIQGVEGIVDYAVGGLAEFFGNDSYSEEVFANDWLDYNHADTWYNPSEGWKFVGDVASGIGTSLPGLAAGAAVTIASGGTGLATGVGLAVSAFSAAGTSTKEAYLESGELTGKQFGYGAIMGGIEAATEKVSGALGAGLGKAVSSISSMLGKSASKTAARVTVKGVAKQLGKEFLGEAFEEGAAEILSPVIKRLTYDKNAEFASADEIAYAALVGGLSGVVMGGVGMGARSVRHLSSGTKISDTGKVAQTLELGQMYADVEANEATGSASIKAISEIMGEIGDVKDGTKLTAGQRRMLGELNEYTTVAPLENIMQRSAISALRGAQPIAAKLASDGAIKLVDGKLTTGTADAFEKLRGEGKQVRDITAEDITKGYDPAKPTSIFKALQDNEVLRYVSASDAAGRLILSASQVEESALSGRKIRNQVDLNKFIEETNKDPERRAALGKELGIADNEWDTLQIDRFNQAIDQYEQSGKAEANKIKFDFTNKAKTLADESAKNKIPSKIALGDGKIQRYKTDKIDIAVAREGDSFLIYDYNLKEISRLLTRAEANTALNELKTAGEVNIPTDAANTAENAVKSPLPSTNQGNMRVTSENSLKTSEKTSEISLNESEKPTSESPVSKLAEVREKLDAKKIDTYARDNITDYDGLSEQNKSMIRKVVREGRALGVADADVLSSARIAARTGVNVEFDSNMNGEDAAYFDPDTNKIVINPKAEKKQELLLIHELDHAVRAYLDDKGTVRYVTYKNANKKLSDETWNHIKEHYADQDINVSREELLADEASAYYTEAILGGKGTIDLLLGEEPTLQQKILSFFTDAAQTYSKDAQLSKEARKHYRQFKKMFNAFAEVNKGMNAFTAEETRSDGKSARKIYASIKAKTADEMQLGTAKQMLKDGASSEDVRKATGWFKGYDGKWRFEINDSQMQISIPDTKYPKVADIVKHDALFEAYPELKDIYVTIHDIENGRGSYSRTFGDIEISRDLLTKPEELKSVMAHELQHAIQDIEGFARGASLEYWEKRLVEGYDSRQAYVKAEEKALLDRIKQMRLDDANNDTYFVSDMEDLVKMTPDHPRGKIDWDTLEQIEEDSPQWKAFDKQRDALSKIYGESEVFNFLTISGRLDQIKHKGERFAVDLYFDTAGEIEARDVQKRLHLDSTERKNTRPDIDREDVVFAEGSSVSYFAKKEYDAEKAGIHEQIRNSQGKLNQMQIVFSAKAPYKVGRAYEAGTWAISELKRYGYQADRQGFGKIYFDEEDIRDSMKYLDTDEEKVSIIGIYKVLKQGIKIGEHGNHKDRGKHTITFAAPVEINGVRGNMAVVVNMRNNKYKVHRILMPDGSIFKFNEKTKNNAEREMQRGVPNGSLANATSSASKNSIPQNSEKSTDSAKKTSETSKSQRKSTNFEATLADEKPIESVAGRDAKEGAKRVRQLSRIHAEKSVGQIQEMIARYTGKKVYSLKESRETIDEIYGIFSLSAKNRAKLYEDLWQGYNTCKTENEKIEFSFDMAEYVTVMLLSESSVENPDKLGAAETVSKLKRGIGHLVFDKIETTDLKSALDQKGWRSFYGRWGFRETAYKDRRRYPLDEFITDLARENAEYAYLQEMTPQDAILELDRIYLQSVDEMKRTVGALDELSNDELRDMISDVGTAIYESFSTKGEKSTAQKVIDAKLASAERKYSDLKQKYDELSQKYYENQSRPQKLLNLSYQIRKMKDLHLGTFLNATDYKNEIFKETFETIGSIEFRGNISTKKVRTAMQKLAEWYKPDNPVLKEMDGVPGSMLYSDYIALLINDLANGDANTSLTVRELDMLDDVLRHATRIVENFNRVWKNGKWVDAESTAKGFTDVANTVKLMRASADMRKLSRFFNNAGKKYLTAFGDPMTLFRYMDGYQDGFFTWAGEELRAGAFRHGVDVMEMKTDYDAFLKAKDHKDYLKRASKDTVKYGGAELSKLQYISLYMTMQRQQAQRGLAFNGFSFIDLTGKRVEVDGFISRVQERLGSELGITKDPDGTWQVSDEQMNRAVESEIAVMKKKLSAEDLQFIDIIERTLNGKCKELKTARDMERLGFSNTISGYYYPIVRAMIAKTIDSRGMWGELDRASNISANKNTFKGAANALWIESADTVFNRHIDAVARYAELSPAIDAINKVFNLDVSGNKNKPVSVRTATYNTWQTNKILGGTPSDAQKHNGEAYLKDLLADLQGISKERGTLGDIVEAIRGGFAVSALAANPKVLVTQLSSLFASTNILSKKSLVTGMQHGFGENTEADVDKYCPIAKLRNYDSSAAKAQGVLDNVRGIGETLMGAVSFMDRSVVRALWGACQAEIESTKKLKVGTEQNKVEAGKLLEKVLLETQQNAVATEKSAAMRSTNMLSKSVTMFTSDAMKAIGRVIDAFGNIASLKARRKMAEQKGDAEQIKSINADLEEANVQARKSVGSLVMTALYMTLIARAFSWLYAKEEDEENPVLAFFVDVFGGMLGGLPLISDIYDFFTNGYEISESVFDTLNDVLYGVRKMANTASDCIAGEATLTELNGAVLSGMQSVCTAVGLPLRNIRNALMGLTRRVLPNAAYRLEMLTETKSYGSDFNKALEAGDESKAYMILELLLSERLLGEGVEASFADSMYINEALRLKKLEYNVLPRTIGNSVTIDGVEIDLTPEEQTALRARYAEAVLDIEALIGSAGYASLTDEQKASAIKFIYDTYYDLGIYELYGYERNMKRRIFSKIVSSDKLALAYTATSGIESTNRRKSVIAAINRLPVTSVEKLFIVAYKGYAIKDGDIRGVSAKRAKTLLSSYARRRGLTSAELSALEQYL